MKLGSFFIGGLILVGIIGYFWVKSAQNDLVEYEEGVKTCWGQVQNQYQRRLDLIPNLVNVVKGSANHEEKTLTAVIEARSKASQMQLNLEDVTEESMKKFQAVQGELSSALSRLMVVNEAYPDLQANQGFRDLQVQLEGTENRIGTERGRFNDACKIYNTSVRKFPRSLIAGMLGFSPKPYFEADVRAQEAPKVEF